MPVDAHAYLDIGIFSISLLGIPRYYVHVFFLWRYKHMCLIAGKYSTIGS